MGAVRGRFRVATVTIAEAKDELRRELNVVRRTRSAEARAAARHRNGEHLLNLLAGSGGTVCGYLPLPSEPIGPELLDELSAAGIRVLVPVTVGSAPLDWVQYRPGGEIGDSYLPDGDRLGPGAVVSAHTVLVPAFAVDLRGYRLGRGGGHYDRTLALAGPGQTLIATLFDGDLVDRVPVDGFDLPVQCTVTPELGVRPVRGLL